MSACVFKYCYNIRFSARTHRFPSDDSGEPDYNECKPNSFEHNCRVHTCTRYSVRGARSQSADGSGYSRQSSRPHARSMRSGQGSISIQRPFKRARSQLTSFRKSQISDKLAYGGSLAGTRNHPLELTAVRQREYREHTCNTTPPLTPLYTVDRYVRTDTRT